MPHDENVEELLEHLLDDASPSGLRCQAAWVTKNIGLEHGFFSALLHSEPQAYVSWIQGNDSLTLQQEETLKAFWQLNLRFLDMFAFDLGKIRAFYTAVDSTSQVVGSAPWQGTSLRSYLAEYGDHGIALANQWLSRVRFGNPYVGQEEGYALK